MLKTIRKQLDSWRDEKPRTRGAALPAGFQGCVDRIDRRSVKGWVREKASDDPVRVSVWLRGEELVSGEAAQSRPDVGEHLGSSGQHGFALKFEEVESDALPELEVRIEGQGAGGTLPVTQRAIQRRSSRYQDFDGDGKSSSRSHDKLKQLRLKELGEDPHQPLRGLSVLDLGCNEGFFCLHALKLGAERVVGVDKVKRHVRSAREHCPDGEFIQGSWWDLPDEQFDVILFLSSIHYESEQKALLRKLRRHLKPGGTLVLECGVASEPGARAWHAVSRGDGVYRYPTRDMLIYDLLDEYSVRCVGRSVRQKGDPVGRLVYHCTPRRPTAMMITGPTRAGKSNLSFDLIKRDIPTYTTDTMLSRMVNGQRYEWSPLAQRLARKFGKKKGQTPDLGRVAGDIVSSGMGRELADLIAAEVPMEADLFSVQGEALSHPDIMRPLVERLEQDGVRVWVMKPAADSLDE